MRYRFEYALVGAVTPAWAIAAGPGSRASDELGLVWPWERIGHVGDRPLITTAHFTGMSPAPWVGPKGWADLLTVYADDEDDDEADGDEHAAADGGTGRDEDRS